MISLSVLREAYCVSRWLNAEKLRQLFKFLIVELFMEVIAHGIDLVDFPRIAEMVERHGNRFLNRVFTATEQAYAESNKNFSI